MAETTSTPRRYPNMIGAGLIAGILAGLALGGWQGNFGLWVPVAGILGLLVGLLLQANGGANRN
ncbi:MAG: hypothetical protein VW999_01980 [Alphaproteobacteria bacterium]|jgi:uncharacterized membrane protein YjjP (DUF1212 family)